MIKLRLIATSRKTLGLGIDGGAAASGPNGTPVFASGNDSVGLGVECLNRLRRPRPRSEENKGRFGRWTQPVGQPEGAEGHAP